MRTIKPLPESKKQDFENDFFVFDVETYGLNPQQEKLAFGVIYGNNFIKVLRTPKEFQNEFKHDRYKNKKIFAHNAEYDVSSIFGNVIENVDNSAIFNGKFISVKYGKTVFVDSSNIYPTSVSKIGDLLNYPKGKTPDKFINPKGFKRKHYINHKRQAKTRNKINCNDINYCILDCKIVFEALLQMFKRVGGIRITIASTAMYYFRKKYLDHTILYNEFNNDFFESYYGGRTEAFKIGKTSSKVYDINSLYPDRMLNIDFPDWTNLQKINNVSSNYFKFILKSKEGFARVSIRHKNTYFGSIPFKCEKTGKLLFPIGEFTTSVNFNELRFASKIGYIEILKVHYCVFANPIESPFIDYVNDLYNERKDSSSDLMKMILKLLLNSLYGKFGMREKFTTTYYKNVPYALIDKLKSFGKHCKVTFFSKNRNDCYVETENLKTKKSFFSIPSIASYITSSARIKLLEGLIKNENRGIVYCDTDSIFLEQFENIDLPISNELGDWKLEDKHITEIRGLKNYSYIENGKHKDAIKGVSKKSIELERFKFRVKKYVKTKEGLRRNIDTGSTLVQEKIITNKYDKRIILSNGNTKPIKIKQ